MGESQFCLKTRQVYHGMPNNLEEDCASGLPIPDIFILGAPIILVHYLTQIFHRIEGYLLYGPCCILVFKTRVMFCSGIFYVVLGYGLGQEAMV